ncbi:hypothetical protein ACV56Z_06990 [Staphylococcus aureus]
MDIPLSIMTVVTGVSGLQSLVNEVLYKSLAQKINKSKESQDCTIRLKVLIKLIKLLILINHR